LSRNLETLTSWNPLGHSRPVKGLLYFLGGSKRKEMRNLKMGIIITQMLLVKGKSRRLRGAEFASSGETADRQTEKDNVY
jgi:hypothetical protein